MVAGWRGDCAVMAQGGDDDDDEEELIAKVDKS